MADQSVLDPEPDTTDPGEPAEEAAGETPEHGMPPKPKPLGMMVAFLPSDIEADTLAVPGGVPAEDLHLTLRYYGEVTDDAFIDAVHDAARTIAGNLNPFVTSVTGRRQLGQDNPPADVLILADDPEFRSARDRLPASDHDYPAFTPHITIGYGIGDDALAASCRDNDVIFDHIVVANGNDDWTVYMLGDIPPEALDDVNPDPAINDDDTTDKAPTDVDPVTAALALAHRIDPTLTAPVTAGIDDVIEGKINAPGSRTKSKTVGKLDPRPGGKHQKCFHGSPISCKSVKWIAVYTALREKRGFSKSKAAAIANAMHNRWKRGSVGPRNHHPIVRKTM